jgi:hypothetical protein
MLRRYQVGDGYAVLGNAVKVPCVARKAVLTAQRVGYVLDIDHVRRGAGKVEVSARSREDLRRDHCLALLKSVYASVGVLPTPQR